MSEKLKKYYRTIPKVFNAEGNPGWKAYLKALAQEDDALDVQIQNAKEQLFVKTASGRFLDILANSLGIARPTLIGMVDDDFRELIPNLSFKPKQIRKAFYDTCEVFFGPLYVKANVETRNFEPFNIQGTSQFKAKLLLRN